MCRISCIIVDDEPLARAGLQDYVQQIDFLELKATCKNAMEAIHILNKHQIDLVFLDINMPVMDGWGFLDEFLKLPNTGGVHIKIITSSIDIRDREKWQSYVKKTGHHIDFITKPIYELNLQDVTRNMNLAS